MLAFISKLIMNRPIKIMAASLMAVVILVAGAINIKMATGNETLIRNDSKVYKDNVMLESEFGGETIIVLYEGKTTKDLLTVANIEHMEGLENRLRNFDEIYSIVSPVTLVKQISQKQNDKFDEGIREMAKGLGTMGLKLEEIGKNIGQSSSKQPNFPDIDTKLKELNRALSMMIEGQQNLHQGTTQLLQGNQNFANQLSQVSVNLKNLSQSLEAMPEQSMQLAQISSQLMEFSQKMAMASQQGVMLPTVSQKTIEGLKNMERGLKNQKNEVNKLVEGQKGQLGNLGQLQGGLGEMGQRLSSIGEALDTMMMYSDSSIPAIPSTQSTLDKMIYDDNGNLREMFNELIIDQKHALFMVKFEGNVKDDDKAKVVSSINEYIDKNDLKEATVLVSGKPVLDGAIRSSMKQSMQKMMGLSVLFMIAVLTIVFKVKWRLLPLATILIAVVSTVGLMGWLGIPITMVSMAVFPILIGLGIDYSIQFHSRYAEEMEGDVI